ncbi:MFS transporter [Nannocystis pusilla]|uniref:MFS transporter n=1 Tax=Nannocystis pusilla TaxID=889268 RepID=UPI003B775C2B
MASLAVFAVFLDTTVLFVAFPSIAATFPAVPTAELSWVLNAYTIVFAAALVPFGRLADRWGHRATFGRVDRVHSGVAAVAAAPTPGLLVAARVLQAAGGAALVPSSLALVMRATPREKLPVALAVWGATGAVAGAVGPTLGAALIEACGWRWVFAINLPVGLVTVLLGRRRLAESRDPDSVLPAPLGVVLLVIAAVLITLALVLGESWGWTSQRTAATLVAGLATLAAFVIHQARTRAPTIDLSLFAASNFRWANAATLTFGAAFTAMFLASVLFLTAVWDWSILAAGFGVAPGPLLVAWLSPRFGRLAARIGQRPLLVVGGLSFALGGCGAC